ncbi:MATE family efflux transporter [Roseivivax sp. THAF30]|uniref:MATE family efflux transporter n=1 Tax=Roseivivax sp. THAF30 TaxID=2587852 RepID=UPI0012A99F58|nr:MATE family efflux transporter [Roseivivax sp. THAF30]QFT61796.1 Multidrug resistance protein NorM [Roseivivax sp. THAF30]
MSNSPSSSSIATVFSFVRTALPIGAFYLTEILVGLTDLAVVGALGTTPLAAVGLAKTILLSIMVVGFAVLSIGTVLMAERSDPETCGRVLVASIVVAAPLVVVAICIAWGTIPILAASGYAADLVADFDAYATVFAWALVPTFMFASLKNALNAVGRTGVIAWFSIGIVLGNLALSIVLVHGLWAWEGFGVAGAAGATVAVNVAAAIGLLIHVQRSGVVRFGAIRARAVCRSAGEIIRLGWAAGAQQALESVLFVVVLYLLGLYSVLWLAAGTVVFAVMELNYAASGAVGEVLAARLAAARADGGNLHRLLRLGVSVSGLAAASLALTVGVFTEATVALFSGAETPPEGRVLMSQVLRWTAPIFIFDAWQIVFMHALRGLRRTVLPMVLSTTCYWAVGLGGGLAFAELAKLGASGIWAGFCLGLTCAAILLGAMAIRTAELPRRGE